MEAAYDIYSKGTGVITSRRKIPVKRLTPVRSVRKWEGRKEERREEGKQQ